MVKNGRLIEQGLDGLNQHPSGVGLEHIAHCAGVQHFANELLGLVSGHDQNACLRRGGAQLTGDIEAVAFGHAQIEHGDIRRMTSGQLARLPPIRGFSDNVPFRPFGQRRDESAADQFVIVGNQYAHAAHAVAAVRVTGNFAWTQVPCGPVRTPSEPPSWRIRSRMPARPTPSAAVSVMP